MQEIIGVREEIEGYTLTYIVFCPLLCPLCPSIYPDPLLHPPLHPPLPPVLVYGCCVGDPPIAALVVSGITNGYYHESQLTQGSLRSDFGFFMQILLFVLFVILSAM